VPYLPAPPRLSTMGCGLLAMSSDAVIPFGKYRGQPLEVLAADRQYADWLMAQPWFRDRYSGIYTVIINNFAAPSDTPEHNALQIRFLERDFCLRVHNVAFPNSVRESAEWEIKEYGEKINLSEHQTESLRLARKYLADGEFLARECRVSFESRGADVSIKIEGGFYYSDILVEIKPTIGDEFPTVLRQMKRSEANVLLCGEYVGVGVSREQLRALFENERIKTVFLSDL
jgi:hypothetical protein